MENRTDTFNEMVEDLQLKTKEYLQPNPTVRAKMAAVKGISKLSGQAKASTYPQPEGTLGEAMSGYGRKLQDYENTSDFAAALIETGETLKQMADLKYALDDTVKQNYLEPLHHMQTKDLKEVLHHRKKLQGRKLDFDCKKRTKATDEEVRSSEEKFAESLNLAQLGMHNLLDSSGPEHISQLTHFSEALLEYHRNCVEVLTPLTEKLYEKTNEASAKPKPTFRPKTLEDLGIERIHGDYNMGGGVLGSSRPQTATPTSNNRNLPVNSAFNSTSPGVSPCGTPTSHTSSGWGSPASGEKAWKPHAAPSPRPSPASTPTRSAQPSCQALYEFGAENPAELSFKEGDIIMLKSQIDGNWYEGMLNGRTGYFPVSYVTIIVPLPPK
jgi:endophilin-A